MKDSDVDWPKALRAVGGDRDLLKNVIQAFLHEAPRLIQQIRAALESRDTKTLMRAAHTIKGSLRFLGSPQACDLALRLEEMSQAGQLTDAGQELSALQAEIERLHAPLVAFVKGADMLS